MKKIKFILIGLLLSFGVSSFAQGGGTSANSSNDEAKFRFGITGAAGYSWLRSDDKPTVPVSGRLAYGFGIIGEYNFADNFAFVSGLNVNYSGGSVNFTGVPLDTNITNTQEGVYSFQYIEIPILLKMETQEIGYMTYFAQVGGSLGFNYRAKADYRNTDLVYWEDDVNITKEINLFRPAFVIGGGLEYNIAGNLSIYGNVMFNNGLLNIFTTSSKVEETKARDPNDLTGDYINKRATNNYVTLNVGVLF